MQVRTSLPTAPNQQAALAQVLARDAAAASSFAHATPRSAARNTKWRGCRCCICLDAAALERPTRLPSSSFPITTTCAAKPIPPGAVRAPLARDSRSAESLKQLLSSLHPPFSTLSTSPRATLHTRTLFR